MDRLSQGVPHSGHRPDDVRARAQMGHVPQELHGVALGLHRVGVGVVHVADQLDLAGEDLHGLAFAFGLHDPSGGDNGAAGGDPPDHGVVLGQLAGRHHLKRGKAGAVGQVDERHAAGADPTPHRDLAADGDLPAEHVDVA